ncbi:MAG: hypothetical protein KAH25_10190, partial [Bacteroidales bacterium]|nr:hypothetical protein [Bacteroidales bacterium]
MAKSRSTIIICMLLFSFHIQAQVEWSSIGAGGGGALSTMTVVDDADNTIYVGCDVGGVFKSTDHGSTWEIKNTGISTYYIHDISYDPVNTNTLYVATRGGIFKSTNRGDNWEIKRSGFPTEGIYSYSAPISDIIIDPNNTNIIYAGMGFLHSGHIGIYESFWVNIANKGAIYKSTDYGENWSLIRETGINTEAKILSLAFDPNNSSILYAATDMGLYKSTTAGDTWSFISADLPHQYTMNILTDPNNSDILYVTLWTEPSNEWEGGVYKSTDGGINWIAKNNGLAQIVGSQEPTTSNYTTLIIDKNNTDVLYAANPCWNLGYGGVYKTIDGGDNWDWVTMPAGSNQNIGWGWLELVTIG